MTDNGIYGIWNQFSCGWKTLGGHTSNPKNAAKFSSRKAAESAIKEIERDDPDTQAWHMQAKRII